VSQTAADDDQSIPVDDVAEFIPDGMLGNVSLIVVDNQGNGMSGTVVRGFNTGRGEPVQPFKPDFIIRTGKDGRWKGELPLGQFMVLATNGPLVAAGESNQAWWNISKGKPKKDLKLTLSEGGEVRVSVIDRANRKSVAGASVILDTGHTAVTDEKGVAIFNAVPKGERVVKVVHPPFANGQQFFNTKETPSASVEVALSPGFEVVGRVLDASGAPVKGANVSDNYSGRTFLCAMQKSVTDGEGRYRLGWYNREKGLWSFTVEHKDFAEQSKGDLKPPSGSDEVSWDFTLDKGWEIKGLVLNEDGKPVEGATVRYGSSWSMVGAKWAKTDAKGRFHIVRIGGKSTWPVVAEAEGYAPGQDKVTPGKGTEVPDISFRLKRGLVTKGRVVDGDGNPVKNAIISPRMLIDDRTEYVGGRIGVDDNGEFEIRNLPASGVSLDMYGNGISAIRDMPFDPTKPLLLTAEKPGVIIGMVLDAETQKPVEKFSVSLGRPTAKKVAGAPDASISGVPQAVQSPEGKFLLEDLINRAGHEVTVRAEGYTKKTVDYVEARPVDDKGWPIEILLRRGVAIRGVLKDSTGTPVTGARVFYVASENWVSDKIDLGELDDVTRNRTYRDVSLTRSDEQGEVTINLPDETPFYSMVVLADGYAPQMLARQPPSQLTFPVLQKEAKIRGQVIDPKKIDPEVDFVAVSTDAVQSDHVRIMKDGSFEFRGLPSGEASVYIYSNSNGEIKMRNSVSLTSGELNEVKMEPE
jgi:hypothetical protein